MANVTINIINIGRDHPQMPPLLSRLATKNSQTKIQVEEPINQPCRNTVLKSDAYYPYVQTSPFLFSFGDENKNTQAKLMKNLSSVPEAHRRLSSRPILPLIMRLWEESRDEATSKLACHVLANLSRSDVHDVRNRLFRVSEFFMLYCVHRKYQKLLCIEI